MYKLVVFSTLLAIAIAKPSVGHHATIAAAATPIIGSAAISHQSRTDFISSPVISSYSAVAPVAAVAHAAPAVVAHAAPAVVAHAAPAVVASAPIVQKTVVASAPSIAYAAVPVTGTAYTKNVHYAEKDVVTGYTSQVLKPNLGALATPLETVSKTNVLAPARAVQTLTPTVTRVEPEVTVNKVTVDVPVQTPVVSEVEVRTPHVVAQPAIAAPAVATSYSVHAAPAVAAPAVAAYHTAPAVAAVHAAPAVAAYHTAPAVAAVRTAPAVAAVHAAPAVTAVRTAPAVAAVHAVSGYAAPAFAAGYSLNAAPVVANLHHSAPIYTEAKVQAW